MTDQTISLTFNGQSLEVPGGTTITELLEIGEIRASVVAVERNREIVPRKQHATTVAQAGDIIEAVTLVGGG